MVHEVDDPAAVVLPWPEDAEPVRFSSLLTGAASLLSRESVTPCSTERLGDLPERMHAAVIRTNWEEAEALYTQGLERAACDPDLTPEVLGQLGFLGGLVATSRGAGDEAVERYREARTWDPSLTWKDWPESLRADFDAATPEEPSVTLVVRPQGDARVDGRALAGSLLTPGRHVLRVGAFGAWIEMPPVDDAIVLPAAFPGDAIGWMGAADPLRRDELAALLGVTLGEGRRAAITDGMVTWVGTTGRADWKETGRLAPGVPEPIGPVDTPVRNKRSPIGYVLIGAGAGVAAIGGAVAAQSYSAANKNLAAGGGWSEKQYLGGRTRYQAGLVATGVGVAVGGTGIAIALSGAL